MRKHLVLVAEYCNIAVIFFHIHKQKTFDYLLIVSITMLIVLRIGFWQLDFFNVR